MPRRRRRKTTRTARKVSIAATAVILTVGYFVIGDNASQKELVTPPTHRPSAGIPLAGVSQKQTEGAKPIAQASPSEERRAPQELAHAAPRIKKDNGVQGLHLHRLALQNDTQGELVEARRQYNDALRQGLPAKEDQAVRSRLTELADEMLLGPKRYPGDSLTSLYVVRSGDTLQRIAKQYHLSAALIARINQLKDENLIRIGQSLKVLHGPFHVEIDKKSHLMSVFLQDTFVRTYPVGLGEQGSTPTGQWAVHNKLINPTYHSPRGEGIIDADDPNNPLGERWIGLNGISGEALGQKRYGIHGTIDDVSIGQDMSLGCIRLFNDDVALLYEMLVVEHSLVVIFE